VQDFYNACCLAVQNHNAETLQADTADNPIPATLTSVLLNTLLAGQSSQEFLRANFKDNSPEFWETLNKARWELQVEVCYCSMLDKCYITEKNGLIEPIEHCPIIDEY
jgi:hypothetical protein